MIPYGVVGSFAGQVMPYLARRAGFELDNIGWFVTVLLVPTWFQFLYAPIVDVWLARKHWLVVVASIGAVCMVAACMMPLPQHIDACLVFGFLAQAISGLVGSCAGGLMAVVIPDEVRGKASAFYNMGNASGGALSASLALWMVGNDVAPIYLGLTLGGMMVVSAFAILWVDEPARDHIQTLRGAVGTMWRDVKAVLLSKSGLTGMLLCLSPVGTAALSNYFSAMAKDYHASTELTTLINGPANALLTAGGAWIGGLLCDRYHRRAMYLLSGALTAVVGILMVVSPRLELTYAWGVCLYYLVMGFCFSAFYATILETIGSEGKAKSAQFALYVAAGNVAIGYTGLVDTRFSAHGVEGIVASDSAMNFIGVIVLGFAFWKLGSFGKRLRARPPELPQATAREIKPPPADGS